MKKLHGGVGCGAWLLAAVAGSALLGVAPAADASHRHSCSSSRSGVSVSIGIGTRSHIGYRSSHWHHSSPRFCHSTVIRRPVCRVPVRTHCPPPRRVSYYTYSSPVVIESFRVVSETPSLQQRQVVAESPRPVRPAGVATSDWRAWQAEQALASRMESLERREAEAERVEFPVVVEAAPALRDGRRTAEASSGRLPMPSQPETTQVSSVSGQSQGTTEYQGIRGANDALAAGRYRIAQELYGEAASENPNQINVRIGYAIASAHLGDQPAAVWALGRALESNPRAFEPTLISSAVREGLTDLAMSIRVDQEAAPTAEGWLLLAAVEHLRLRSGAAEDAWNAARDAGADDRVLRNLGIALGTVRTDYEPTRLH